MHTIRNKQGAYTDNDFWTQWSSVNPRMALFIKVTPKSFWTGVSAVGFTSNSRDITLSWHSMTFKSAVGINPSSVAHSLSEATQMEVTGIYQDTIFKRDDVIAGKWDYADIEVFSACWDNPSLGELVHFKGNLGEFKDYSIYFTAEGRGLLSRLSQDTTIVSSRSCRVNEFRDATCGHTASTVTIDSVTYDIVYTNIAPNLAVSNNPMKIAVNKSYWTGQSPAKPLPPNGFFINGVIECTTGKNAGVRREILLNQASAGTVINFKFKRPFPYNYLSTDRFTITAGCNRTVEDCRKYGNIINFRGEPYVPGIEAMNRIPTSS